MKQLLNIFVAVFGLFALVACVSAPPNPAYRPQANTYYEKSPDFSEQVFERGYDHVRSIFDGLAIVPSNPVMTVSWDLIPENDRREARRLNCEITVKGEHAMVGDVYECLGVEKNGADYLVRMKVDGKVKELNLTAMPGGFTEGGFYERPFNVSWIKYGSRGSKKLRVVWSTHAPVRGY